MAVVAHTSSVVIRRLRHGVCAIRARPATAASRCRPAF